MKSAFVTGATGLLGNNLVRELLDQGIQVKALARNPEKATKQFGRIDGLEIVEGDMERISGFADVLKGVDVVFHTAAYFRESYSGGTHWDMLKRINVDGTRELLEAAYKAGIRRVIHTSSIAVLNGEPGQLIDETMMRPRDDSDDYYRSKILSDEVVIEFLNTHPDMNVTMVLPGWMHGPGDMGPTQAGQFTLDYMNRKLPGIPPATFSYVDARDVALAQIAAVSKGRRGERYLAAGRHRHMGELMKEMETVTGVKSPTMKVPWRLMWVMGGINELWARISGRPVLVSSATVHGMKKEFNRSHFDHQKSFTELGISFRPVAETIADEVAWFHDAGMIGA